MSLLFKHFRVHNIFGASTDVGKTLITTALVKASAKNVPVFYLKPISTGHSDDADDTFVKTFVSSPRVTTKCLFRYDEPVSPHLAAKMSQRPETPSDETVVKSIAEYIRYGAAATVTSSAHMYVETAGGVHSPSLSGNTQAEVYRSLFLPTILVGDSRLGGISTTIAAYEALQLRGYILDAILLFRDAYYQNADYLRSYFAEHGVWVGEIERPPSKVADRKSNFASTDSYFDSLMKRDEDNHTTVSIPDVVKHLDKRHTNRLAELDSMPRRTLDTIWWPFVQHGLVKSEADVNVIDSASSDFFSIYRGLSASSSPNSSLLVSQFDSSASWWTQTFGHAYTPLTLAAARAGGRYGHVMFPQATHLPALKLSEALVNGPGRGWASRVFLSDNGSTGMEVAIKMALRAFTRRVGADTVGKKERLGVLGLTGSYHGDTIGAMNACEAVGVYTCEWHDAKGIWLEPPTVSFKSGQLSVSLPPALQSEWGGEMVEMHSLNDVYDVDGRKGSTLEVLYRRYVEGVLRKFELNRRKVPEEGTRLAALVLEPLVMGAGGMVFVDPLFQRVMVDVVRSGDEELGVCSLEGKEGDDDWRGLPVVYDEVFAGLYRLGVESAGRLLGVEPDIAVNAKILTGGLVPLAATLAKESIFRAFLGSGKESALLHGHSYSAHAVGCEVAGESLRLLDKLSRSDGWNQARLKWGNKGQEGERVWSFWDPEFVDEISRAKAVKEAMTLGCVLAIKVRDEAGGYTSHSAQQMFKSLNEDGEVHFRTLGNVAYFMSSLNTRTQVLQSLQERIRNAVEYK